MKLPRFWIWLTFVMFVMTYIADVNVANSLYLWIFSILCFVLLRSISQGQFSWFYTFMVVFFFLGCWLKVLIHNIFDYPYIEPTGNFDDSVNHWRAYFFTSYLFIAAFLISKFLITIFFKRSRTVSKWQFVGRPTKPSKWLTLIGLSAIFYTINNMAAFNVTGVNPIVKLPFSLNAPIAFMALIGISVVISMYLARDVALKQRLDALSTMAVLIISGMASVSMASRAAIFMQAMPMLIAATYVQATTSTRTVSIRPFLLFGVALIVVLVVVALYRINIFSGGSSNDSELLIFSVMENVMLVIDRWIGAEQILVGVSQHSASVNLFLDLLQEDPTKGVSSIYQTIAGSKYEILDKLTFLTLPGYFGVLSLSGSSFVVFFGIIFITTLGMIYEIIFLRKAFFGQAICVALVSAAIANSLTQLSFPRLVLPFMIQMTVLVLVLHFFLRRQLSRLS